MNAPAPHQIALSFDVEDWYHIPLVSGATFSPYPELKDFFAAGIPATDTITGPTLDLLAQLKQRNIRATFFVVAELLERYPALTEALKRSDHEIGCHSLYHTIPIDTRTRAAVQATGVWAAELREAKTRLEAVFQRPVTGYRAPGAYFAAWMIPVLKAEGFTYDSSVAPNGLYNKTDFDAPLHPLHPYRLDDAGRPVEDGSGLAELPWNALEIAGFRLPAGGAFFFRALGLTYTRLALQQRLRHSDTMFYLHPVELADGPFPMANVRNRPGYSFRKGAPCRRDLLKLLDIFQNRWTTCAAVYDRMKARPHAES